MKSNYIASSILALILVGRLASADVVPTAIQVHHKSSAKSYKAKIVKTNAVKPVVKKAPIAQKVAPKKVVAAPPPKPTVPPAVLAAEQDALKSLRRMKAATAIGVTQNDYHERLIDASADVAEDLRQVPQGELRQAISGTLQAYVDAATFWQKTIDATYGLPPASKFESAQDVSTTEDLDAYNNDPDISAIESRYNIPKAAADSEAMRVSANTFQQELAAFDKFTPSSSSSDPALSDPSFALQVDEDKLGCIQRYHGRTVELERIALTSYVTSSLSVIWAFADQQEQKAEPLASATTSDVK